MNDATTAPSLSDLQAQLAVDPNNTNLIEQVRAETSRVLGEKDVLPADGSPSEQQVGRADQGQGLRAKLSSSIPGREPYMDLLDQIVALNRVTKHESSVLETQRQDFTLAHVDRPPRA